MAGTPEHIDLNKFWILTQKTRISAKFHRGVSTHDEVSNLSPQKIIASFFIFVTIVARYSRLRSPLLVEAVLQWWPDTWHSRLFLMKLCWPEFWRRAHELSVTWENHTTTSWLTNLGKNVDESSLFKLMPVNSSRLSIGLASAAPARTLWYIWPQQSLSIRLLWQWPTIRRQTKRIST